LSSICIRPIFHAAYGGYREEPRYSPTKEFYQKKGFFQCCGSGMFIPDTAEFFPSRIPDPYFFYPGSQIHIK
jgi:hypothetical protein